MHRTPDASAPETGLNIELALTHLFDGLLDMARVHPVWSKL